MSDDFEVVIVGGGPVGLWLACELALAKVRVAILERRTDRVTQSRALAIHGRTLEVFALRGLADRFLARGRPVPTGHYGALNTPLDFSVFDTRFPFLHILPQATTEGLLEVRALELGVDIKRGYLVETIEQHTECVIAKGRNGAAPFQLFARYIVGADGARSMVRRAAAIDFPGHPARHTMMLGDVVLDSPPAPPMVTIVNEAGGMLVVQLGDGLHHRIVVVDELTDPNKLSEPVSLSGLAAAATRIAGTDFRPRDPIWLSRFSDETRLAEHYRKERVLLAGDAAHIHSPMGGQGMNVGIQDAMNLGWKLASVLRDTAPEALLDTYERERWPIGDILRRNTLAQLALFSSFDPSMLALRCTLDNVLRVPDVNRQLSEEVSGFGVVYPEPLFLPAPGWQHRKGVSGHRLPDMDLTLQDGSRTTLSRLLEDGNWLRLQLSLSPDEKAPSETGSIKTANLPNASNHPVLANLASVLVRPDGYLGHVRAADDARDAASPDT
jgi:2-polyprenyl-6-methoxyphenol hydroxylase-like FAD-dependent oxidoreductase